MSYEDNETGRARAHAAGQDVLLLREADLDSFSVEALQNRILFLKEEIGRCETLIQSKGEAKNAAESLFKS